MGGQVEAEEWSGVPVSFEKMMERLESGALAAKRNYEAYYEGRSRLRALGMSLPPNADVLEVQAPFAKMSVDVLTEVLIPSGFILSGDEGDGIIDLLRDVWQANDLDSNFNLAAAEALVSGAVFWVVAPPSEGHPYASVRPVPSTNARCRIDHAGAPIEGVAVYRHPDGGKGATYYTPEGVKFYREGQYGWSDTGQGRVDSWGMSMVPMFNRARVKDRYGRSDLAEMAPIIDAASRTLTNLQVAQEVAAMPMRAVVADGAAEKLDKLADKMDMYMGSLAGLPKGSSLEQLPGANLEMFNSTYRLYALQISAMTGIPPSMLGVTSDSNPTSAEALRVSKDRLIMRAEAKQRMFSDALESVARKIVRMHGGPAEGLETLEVTWRDAAAPSVSAMAANALQAQSQGVISNETAAEFMHLSPEQLKRERAKSRDVSVMSGDLA